MCTHVVCIRKVHSPSSPRSVVSRARFSRGGSESLACETTIKQSNNQSSNQAIKQSNNQSINQSIKQSNKQTINQSIKQSINQSSNQTINQTIFNVTCKAISLNRLMRQKEVIAMMYTMGIRL